MKQPCLSSFFREEDAQALVEYAVITALFILAAYGALRLFREALANAFNTTARRRGGELGIGP